MNIPRDVLRGDVLLRVSGNREAVIENYRSILLLTKEEVVIACKQITIRVYGKQLQVCYFSGSDMKVVGEIETITYLSNGELCC